MKNRKYTFIDLFAGCGGLSEGFYKEGYKALAHLEIDKNACKTLATRMKHYNYSEEIIDKSILCEDITDKKIIKKLDEVINENVDIVIGGPPCQAFSSVGRAQDPDSMKNDPRNYLFENYLKVLNHFNPKIFIFENVKGILTAKPKGVRIFYKMIEEMRKTYKVSSDVDTILVNAVNYGVPQMRERVILVGIRNDIDLEPEDVYKLLKKTNYAPGEKANGLKKYYTVKDAIYDLPRLLPGEGEELVDNYKTGRNAYLKLINDIPFNKVLNHVARNHNNQDIERYKLLSENNWQLKDLQKVRPDLVHHDPKHFGNRYTVQSYNKPGKTIVAHLYKDGNLFIHPDPSQGRTFTVREAARIQSFPDNFVFEGSRTEQYKQVGNAVPPLLAQAFAKAIKKVLNKLGE